ncbi:type II toxin-antitoxin system VapC family toxin [Spirulina sp. CCNP1310]|uniref:type II toxin-antitoxin system VapC family toxin n=1 Tax=Spirulina sp. CCNP1310 TaxID=3110249 RepID=UPI002B20E589|nr:type II toxin-antitoxin system VapC family toxin [Spirulina sp. CCNP1310]MEA5420462.1 type II toxin-antitoxin system VapC family toxin [Spirulina sp. CCNP1310]
MKYLLDTDHISFLQRGAGSEFSQLKSRMSKHPISDFALSIISFHEQVRGAHDFINRAKNNTELARGYMLLLEIQKSFSQAPILPFDAKAITIFDEVRSQKVRVATMDLRIAAIAIANNLVLLTRNSGDFSKVPNLIIEDWTV